MDLDQCRKDINNLDKSLLELLAQRRAISRKVIEDKLERGLDLRDPKREGEILETLIKAGRELGWKASVAGVDLARLMVDADIAALEGGAGWVDRPALVDWPVHPIGSR